jgi:hypothetical protein
VIEALAYIKRLASEGKPERLWKKLLTPLSTHHHIFPCTSMIGELLHVQKAAIHEAS